MTALNRRNFIRGLGAGSVAAGSMLGNASPRPGHPSIKPISGSAFEIQHHDTLEGVDFNPALVQFTGDQWDLKIGEIAETGMEYLILSTTALDYRSFYPSKIFPSWKLKCDDPLEAVLSAADKHDIKFFIANGFYGNWMSPCIILDRAAARKRLEAIEEIAQLYGHHKSFYGWYWADEAFIDRCFSEEFIHYANTCSRLARQVTPHAQIMISPYGTRVAVPDDKFVRQLDSLDVDVISYQDEVGVRKSKVDEISGFYEGLRKAHDRAQKKKLLWADTEIFQFEGTVYESALLPAPFERVLRQMEAVSPWVDMIVVYEYQGMMNKPGSPAFCGTQASTKLYSDYMGWLKARG